MNNVGTVTNQSGSGTGSFSTISSVIGTNVTGLIQNSAVVPLVLSGPNTYSGGTQVNAGTLLVNNTTGPGAGSGAVTVASGATLGGSGSLTVVSATITGTVAPGATIGATTGVLALSTTGGTTINGLLAIGITATGSSTLTTTGGLTLGNASTLKVTGTSGAADYDLANYTGTLAGTFGTLNIPSGYSVNYAGTDFGGTSIELVTAVPEPSTRAAVLLCLGVLGFQLRRRIGSLRVRRQQLG